MMTRGETGPPGMLASLWAVTWVQASGSRSPLHRFSTLCYFPTCPHPPAFLPTHRSLFWSPSITHLLCSLTLFNEQRILWNCRDRFRISTFRHFPWAVQAVAVVWRDSKVKLEISFLHQHCWPSLNFPQGLFQLQGSFLGFSTLQSPLTLS